MKIGLDFHGVVVDSARMKAERAPHYGKRLTRSMFLRNMAVGRGGNRLTIRQYRDLKIDVYWRPHIARQVMTPVQGAVSKIKRLLADGHEVVVISSSSRRHVKIARSWCNRIGLKQVEVIGIGMCEIDKSEAAQQRGLDVFVDNDPEKLRLLRHAVKKRFLFAEHNNEHVDLDGFAHRVTGWNELYEEIRKLNA
ncbi:hypothetical protein A3E39_02255 [Candidatus Uhrbacteria bacterium RIFCSPHIGHO2_12_FULL_60_25]|uniref:FCP1 homology domain-containing protein n=1 Tax=Candidatus Uhrbacteria bacterium RIFCSPHIGHO2_12_FULL_60_25 TaxID=1802399 RepID=A0A1F7UL88_9BACT|nr:MAG: hypothetical protein A3E39_02255 [Candidatus Uhrbacteria bacterium RIFCSPHIGHO2_12_FULL_60_25]